MSNLLFNQLKEQFIGKKGTEKRIRFDAEVESVLSRVKELKTNHVKEIPDGLMPNTVYRYENWNDSKPYTKRLITEREVYMANPKKDFNTEGHYEECRLPRRYDLVVNNISYIKNLILSEVASGENHYVPPESENELDQLTLILQDNLKNHTETEEEVYEKRYKKIGIFCTSNSKKNLRLWEWKGDGKGYCVGFKTSELLKYKDFFGICGEIDYYTPDNQPVILPVYPFIQEKKLQNPIITEVFSIPKEHFEEEDEYRFFNCKDGKPYNYTDEGRKKVLPESAFSELIISHQMPPKNRKELLECAARTMPNVPIFEAKIINPNVEFTRIK